MGRIISRTMFLPVLVLTLLFSAGCSSDSTTGPGGGGDTTDKGIWYVDDDAIGSGDGRSWENAFTHPAPAMQAASSGDQIWIAEGTYYGPGTKNVPVVSFKDSVSIYGGFEGGETDLSQRDWIKRAIFEGSGVLNNVVTGADGALLHSIVIRNGNATSLDAAQHMRGGGIYCLNDRMRIARCSIAGCDAFIGGGIYAEGDTVVIDSCIIDSNNAIGTEMDGAGGGGVCIVSGKAYIRGCSISQNSAAERGSGLLLYNSSAEVENSSICENGTYESGASGGGVYIHNAESVDLVSEFNDCNICWNYTERGAGVTLNATRIHFSGCNFHHNGATVIGSAVYSVNSSYLIEHCKLESNNGTAVYTSGLLSMRPRLFDSLLHHNGNTDQPGGAIYNWAVVQEIEFCTIADNRASEGGGIYGVIGSATYVKNCILWDNYAVSGGQQVQLVNGGTATISYSDIDQDGYFSPALFNFRSDPLFTWVGMTGLYYLSHVAAGQDSDSPCIDAADGSAESYGLDTRNTRTDFVTDTGTADIGFHHQPGEY